jgi:hypothetical protein
MEKEENNEKKAVEGCEEKKSSGQRGQIRRKTSNQSKFKDQI